MASGAAAYQQKHLNRWISTTAAWLSVDGWRKGQSTDVDRPGSHRRPVLVGVDLSAKLDLTALVALFPPPMAGLRWRVLSWVWTPRGYPGRAGPPRSRAVCAMAGRRVFYAQHPARALTMQVIRAMLAELRSKYVIANDRV